MGQVCSCSWIEFFAERLSHLFSGPCCKKTKSRNTYYILANYVILEGVQSALRISSLTFNVRCKNYVVVEDMICKMICHAYNYLYRKALQSRWLSKTSLMYIAHVLPFSDQPAQGRYSLAGEHPIVCNGLIDDECGGHPL